MCTWTSPPRRLELNGSEVHLWRVDLDRHPSAIPAVAQTLAPEERRQAAAFRSERDRHHYILARGALRSILALYLQTKPGGIVFCYGAQGKPELAGGPVRFNVSHSGALALYAISNARDVGVDVERVRPGMERDVAGWFLSLRGIRFLEALPPRARRRAFFQGWTRMEAYSKARGEGIVAGLKNFETFLGGSDSVSLCAPGGPPKATPWWLHDFRPRAGYVAALAAQGGKCGIKYWNWHVHHARRSL